MNTFEEKVTISEETVTVEVTCKQRVSINEPKQIYKKNVMLLIPDELRPSLVLQEAPTQIVSNMKVENHTNTGVWVFCVKHPAPPEPRQTKTTRTRRRRLSKKTS